LVCHEQADWPCQRGAQPRGVWSGLAGAELGIHAGEPVNSSVLEYFVSRFGGFDVIVASDRSSSEKPAQVLTAARHALNSGDAVDATQAHDQRVGDIWAALERGTRAALDSMQRSGEPLAADRLPAWNRPVPPNLGPEWIIATFRHETGDETGEPLLHTHNVVPTMTGRQWSALRHFDNNQASSPREC